MVDSSSFRGRSEGSEFLRCDFEAKNSFLADDRLWTHRCGNAGSVGAPTGAKKSGDETLSGAPPPPTYSRQYQDWNGVRVPQPPDFSLRNHEPKPLKRNSREANDCDRFLSRKNGDNKDNDDNDGSLDVRRERRRAASHPLPERPLLPNLLAAEKKQSAGFVAAPKMLRPQEAKSSFVKEGQFQKGPYEAPKHHDHRDLTPVAKLGLPEMDFTFDSSRLSFKRRSRDVVYGLHLGPAPKDWLSIAPTHLNDAHMARPWKPQPKWVKNKLLEKRDYPRYTCLPQKEYTEEFTRGTFTWTANSLLYQLLKNVRCNLLEFPSSRPLIICFAHNHA